MEVSERLGIISRVDTWRKKHISDRELVLVLAFAVGFLASLAAYVLHFIIKQIEELVTSGFQVTTINWLYLIYPVVGIWLTSLFVKYVVRDNISHGITRVLYAISTKQSRLKPHNTWSSIVASAITIGFGGSVGAEAPIVLTGSAIGSNLGKIFHLDNRTLMLLVGCGATAAVSGIFKAPIAGLVFTLEVLMVDLTMASLLPILIASVTATCFSYFFTGGSAMYHFQMDYLWGLDRVPPTILLGIACGFLSLYFMRMMSWCENGYGKLSSRPYLKLLVGGLVLSPLIFLFPSLYGEGYSSLGLFIEGKTEADWMQVMSGSMFAEKTNFLVLYVGLVMLTKVFATSATNGAGGCGGTFAPALFIGGFGGFFFARLWNIQQLGVYVPEKNFTLYGMAAVMAAVMHAPLTGIFLIAELTGGYQLFIPLIIVTISSYLTINIFEHHSIYAVRLAKQGKLLTHHTDKSILTLMSMDKIIDRDFTSVGPDMEMGQLVHALSASRNDYIPVLNESGSLLGEIDINKLRYIIFRTELYHRFHVSQLMTPPAATLGAGDPMEDVMKTFDRTGAQNLPVVSVDGRLIGYISRARLYSMYRQLVADFSAE
ncbi:chloride channel protein [Prevotella denticola]|jgi:putative chloride channel|uniref:chloride channel protein n=1 Tax=Prevotella denticola TaxID=28129 RepID=UPI0002012552|nr:chloride channel protein [Prevotella denticola]AEA21428.1 chloride transporter, ClC family [Prevotella denticola F0289]AXV49631.1 chloride channel protein [Prevotella denticola]KGF40269.1 chloride channel protein [Prevotella denticola DNF00960]MBF1388807.1 chloride channel protein [Prevotella denticola]MBW4713713.1 chloride channel protein [Prevotella denticola]